MANRPTCVSHRTNTNELRTVNPRPSVVMAANSNFFFYYVEQPIGGEWESSLFTFAGAC